MVTHPNSKISGKTLVGATKIEPLPRVYTLYLLDILGIFKSSKHETNDNPSFKSSEYDIHSNLSFQHGYFNMGHCITQPKQCATFAGKSRKNQSSTFAINQFGSPPKRYRWHLLMIPKKKQNPFTIISLREIIITGVFLHFFTKGQIEISPRH